MSADIIQALQFVFSSRYETDPAGAKAFSKETQAIIKGAEDVAESLKGSGSDITKRLETISAAVKDTAKQLSKTEFVKSKTFTDQINAAAAQLKISGKNLVAAKENIIKNFLAGDDKALQKSKLGQSVFKGLSDAWEKFVPSEQYEAQARKLINTVIKSNQKTDAALKAVVDSRAKWEYNIAKQSRQLDTAQQDANKASVDAIFKDAEKRVISAKEAEQKLQALSRQIDKDVSKYKAAELSKKQGDKDADQRLKDDIKSHRLRKQAETARFKMESVASAPDKLNISSASESTQDALKKNAASAKELDGMLEKVSNSYKDGKASVLEMEQAMSILLGAAQKIDEQHKSIISDLKAETAEAKSVGEELEKQSVLISNIARLKTKIESIPLFSQAEMEGPLGKTVISLDQIEKETQNLLNDLRAGNGNLEQMEDSYKNLVLQTSILEANARKTNASESQSLSIQKAINKLQSDKDKYAGLGIDPAALKFLDDAADKLKILQLSLSKGIAVSSEAGIALKGIMLDTSSGTSVLDKALSEVKQHISELNQSGKIYDDFAEKQEKASSILSSQQSKIDTEHQRISDKQAQRTAKIEQQQFNEAMRQQDILDKRKEKSAKAIRTLSSLDDALAGAPLIDPESIDTAKAIQNEISGVKAQLQACIIPSSEIDTKILLISDNVKGFVGSLKNAEKALNAIEKIIDQSSDEQDKVDAKLVKYHEELQDAKRKLFENEKQSAIKQQNLENQLAKKRIDNELKIQGIIDKNKKQAESDARKAISDKTALANISAGLKKTKGALTPISEEVEPEFKKVSSKAGAVIPHIDDLLSKLKTGSISVENARLAMAKINDLVSGISTEYSSINKKIDEQNRLADKDTRSYNDRLALLNRIAVLKHNISEMPLTSEAEWNGMKVGLSDVYNQVQRLFGSVTTGNDDLNESKRLFDKLSSQAKVIADQTGFMEKSQAEYARINSQIVDIEKQKSEYIRKGVTDVSAMDTAIDELRNNAIDLANGYKTAAGAANDARKTLVNLKSITNEIDLSLGLTGTSKQIGSMFQKIESAIESASQSTKKLMGNQQGWAGVDVLQDKVTKNLHKMKQLMDDLASGRSLLEIEEDLKDVLLNVRKVNNEYGDIKLKQSKVEKKDLTGIRIEKLTSGPVPLDINSDEIKNVKRMFAELYSEQNITAKSTHQLAAEYDALNVKLNALQALQSKKMQDDSAARREINDMRSAMHELQGSLYAIQYTAQTAFTVIKEVVTSSMSTFGKFEEELNRFAAVSYKTGDSMMTTENNMRKFGEEAIRVALNSKLLITDVEKAGVVLAKMGFSAQEATGMLKTIVLASEASGESVTKVATTIANVSAAYGKQAGALAQPVEHIADVITRIALETKADIEEIGTSFKYVGAIAEETGQDFHTVGAMLELIGKHGIVGSQAGTSVRQILLSLVKDTPDAVKAMDILKISAKESNGEIKDSAKFLKEYAVAMKGLPNSMKAKFSEDIFVTTALPSAMALVSELEKNENALTETIRKQKEEVNGLTQDMKNLQFKGYSAEVAELKGRIEGLALAFGRELEPAALVVVRALAQIITTISELSPGMKKFLIGVTVAAGGLSVLSIGLSGFLMVASQVAIGVATVKDLLLKFGPVTLEAGAAASTATIAWKGLSSIFSSVIGVIGGVFTGFTQMGEAADVYENKTRTLGQQLWELEKIFLSVTATVVTLMGLITSPIWGGIAAIGALATGGFLAFWWEWEKAAQADKKALDELNNTMAVRLSTKSEVLDLLKKEADGVALTAQEYRHLAHAISQTGVAARERNRQKIATIDSELEQLNKTGYGETFKSEIIGETSKNDDAEKKLLNLKNIFLELDKKYPQQTYRDERTGELRPVEEARKDEYNKSLSADANNAAITRFDKAFSELMETEAKARATGVDPVEQAKANVELGRVLIEYTKSLTDIEANKSKMNPELYKAVIAKRDSFESQVEKAIAQMSQKEKAGTNPAKAFDAEKAQLGLFSKQTDLLEQQTKYQHTLMALEEKKIALAEKAIDIEELKQKLVQAGGDPANIPGGAVGSLSGIGLKAANQEADQLISIAERVSGAYGTCYNTVYRAYRKHFGDEGMFGKISGDTIPAYKAAVDLAKDARYFEVQLDKNKDFWSQIKKGDTGVFDAGGRSDFSYKYGHIENYDPEKKMAHHFSHDKLPAGRNMRGMRLFRLKSWQSAGADPQTQRPSGKLKSHEELTIQRQELLSQKDKLTQEKARKIQEEIDELKKRLGTVPKVSGSAPKLSEEVIAQKEGESDKDFKKRQTQFNAEQKATEAKLKNFDKAKGEFNEISQSIADKEKELMELTGESMETETRRLQLELERKQKEKEIQQSELSFIKDMIEMETQLLELNYMQRDAADSSYQANLRNIKLQEDASWEQEKALYSLTDSDREKSKSHQKYLRQVEIETIKHFRVLEQLDKEYINRQFELDSQMAEMKAQSLSDDITRLKSLAAIESTKRKKKFNDDMEEARKKQGYEAIQAKISENYRKEELIADRNLKIELLKSIEEVTQKRYEAMAQQISMASKLGADVLDAASMDRRRSTVGNVKESIEAYDALKNAMAGPLFITEKMLDEQVSGLNEVNKLRQYQLVLIDKEIQAMRDNGKPQSEINEMVQKRKVLADELLKSQIIANDLTKQSVKDFIKLSQQAKQTKEDMTKMGESFEQFSGGLGKLMDAMSGGDSGFASFFSGMNEGWKSITDLTEKYITALAQISAINGSIDDQSFIPKTIDGTKQLIALGKQLGESSKKNDILSFEDMLKENSKVTNKEKIGDIKNQLVKMISHLIGNNEDMLNWGDIAKEALVSSGGSMTGSSPEEKMDLIKRMLFKGQNLASAGINAASGLKIPKLWDKNRNVGSKSKGLPKKQGEWGDLGKNAMSGMDGDNQASDLISTIGGVASAVIPVAGTVMSIIGGAIGFFGEMDKKKKELEKELAVSRADLLAAEAEFLDKRADIFFEKGDISAALYQENKIIAARKKFQAELDKTNIEIREQEEKAKPGWFGFMGEEQKIAQAKADQLKMQKATKFEELPQQMRDVEAEAAKKSVERENELLDANVRVRKVKAELYGDSIGLIQIEAEEKNNALNKELELGYIEQKRLGYTEQANKKVLELERAILQERMKLNSQTQLSIKLEGQRLLMTAEQIRNRSVENLNPYAKGELTKSHENLRLEDAQRRIDLEKEYFEWQGKVQAFVDKGQAAPDWMLEAAKNTKAELDDIERARKKGGLSTKTQAVYDEQAKMQESNLYKMGNEVERISAQLRDDQFKQAELDELDALRDLEDAKRQEKRKYNADDNVNQLKVDKSFSAKEEKIRRDTAERKVQIEMDWRKRVRDLSASEAANTSDDLDDIKIAYANTSAEIADEWGKAKQFMSGDKLAQREKELLAQQLAANIEYFNKLADLRKRDLDEIIELDNLKAQNTRDSLNIAVTDYQGQMQQIMYDEAVALERYKDNEAKKAYYTEYYEEKKKNLKINAEKSVADAAIDQLNKLSQVKELQFELEMRVYEKEIKANERKISDLQRKIDKLERDKAKIEREIDEAQRKFKVEDKGKFKDALGGINIDQTLRDALEYISNPTANQTKDAAMETAMDAVKTQVDYLKSKAESAYALEDIDATEYYRQMISAVLQQAKAAQYALANLDTEQKAEMQRYILAGKNEDELRVVRKHHMLERMKMEGMYSDAYKDYQKLNDEALEVTRKEEIEAIDEKIDKEKQAIEDLQWINEDKKRIIEDARFKMEEVTDKIKEKVQDLTLATGNWGFSLEDAKNDAVGVFDAILVGYDAAKAKLQEVLTLKVDAPILDLLAKITGTDFSKVVAPTAQSTGATQNFKPSGATAKENSLYIPGSNGDFTEIMRKNAPEGNYNIPYIGPDKAVKFYQSSSDIASFMKAAGVPGFKEGRSPMFTGNGSARPGDYLPAMVKNNEWIVPDDKMREMARGMVKDAFGGRAMTGGATTFNMSFGNVYGVDDLKGTINEAIRKANMDDGYHNSVYLVGNN